MELILREDVERLGRRGDIVKVKPEYARTFLIPKRLAVAATDANKKMVEEERKAHLKEASLKAEAEDLAKLLTGMRLTFLAHEYGQRSSPVNAKDVAEALAIRNIVIDRRKVQMWEPITAFGDFKVTLLLHRDVIAEINVEVVRDEAPSSPAFDDLLREATRVFGDEVTAKEWLDEPIASLAGRRPNEMICGSALDRQRVLTILGRIENGIF